jgi:hypothetical protein
MTLGHHNVLESRLALQIPFWNLYMHNEYILSTAQSKMLEILALYVQTGSLDDLVDMFPCSHLLQNLWLLLTSLINSSQEELAAYFSLLS